jgi:hypothetical protein
MAREFECERDGLVNRGADDDELIERHLTAHKDAARPLSSSVPRG